MKTKSDCPASTIKVQHFIDGSESAIPNNTKLIFIGKNLFKNIFTINYFFN